MTLDEAIKHCEETAKEIRWQALKERMDIEGVAECETCAEEHEQLAEWLKELKARRDAENEILDVIHKTIYQFFDVCGDDEEVPMSDKDKLLLEVNKAICNSLRMKKNENSI